MEREDLFTKKQYLDKNDIMNLFDCGTNKAYAILQSIKIKSDIASLDGKVTLTDFDIWYNQRETKSTEVVQHYVRSV